MILQKDLPVITIHAYHTDNLTIFFKIESVVTGERGRGDLMADSHTRLASIFSYDPTGAPHCGQCVQPACKPAPQWEQWRFASGLEIRSRFSDGWFMLKGFPCGLFLLSQANPTIIPTTTTPTNNIKNKKPNIIILNSPFLFS